MVSLVEYVWLDGNKPTQQIRAKARVLDLPANPKIEDIPRWSFDGSSTEQAVGSSSDCWLDPVAIYEHPMDHGYLVLCEVLSADESEHETNTRALLRRVISMAGDIDAWFGFEQEYTLFENNRPLGWPEHGYPGPQGPYYCGVGTRQIFGREFAQAHRDASLNMGLLYFGMNAEVMPGQWEYQIGYRGFNNDIISVLRVCDELWISRWLLHRISEDFGYHVSLANKPMKGEWNGAGLHTNFSTRNMRCSQAGKDTIERAISSLAQRHHDHISLYGDALSERLTGEFETAPIDQFSWGVGSRDTSIRMPLHVSKQGYGYIEDRRPGANADPYLIAARIIASIEELSEHPWSE